MPIWCRNKIKILGNDDVLDKIEALHVIKEVLDFHSVIPLPEELENDNGPLHFRSARSKDGEVVVDERLIEKYGFDNSYDWCVNNWGTKWAASPDSYRKGLIRSPGCLEIWFETAWSPPYPVLLKLTEIYPVRIAGEATEEGPGYYDKFVLEGGEATMYEPGRSELMPFYTITVNEDIVKDLYDVVGTVKSTTSVLHAFVNEGRHGKLATLASAIAQYTRPRERNAFPDKPRTKQSLKSDHPIDDDIEWLLDNNDLVWCSGRLIDRDEARNLLAEREHEVQADEERRQQQPDEVELNTDEQ